MAFLSKCADSKFEIPNKSIAINPNHAHFRLAFKFEDNLHGGCEEGLLKTHFVNIPTPVLVRSHS